MLNPRDLLYWDKPFPTDCTIFYDSTRFFTARLIPDRSPSVSNLFPSERLHIYWASRKLNLVLRVQMISSIDRALGFLSTRSCNTVPFIWNYRTLQYMKEVATKVDGSIGADTVPLTRRAIYSILFPKFSTSCPGSSVNLIFCKAWTSARTAEQLTCCWFWMKVKKN